MNVINFENGFSYVNTESVQVGCIQYTKGNIRRISHFLVMCDVPHGDQSVKNDRGDFYLVVAESYRDADEENPSDGDYFVIFPDKRVTIYTPAEFEANFKLVTED